MFGKRVAGILLAGTLTIVARGATGWRDGLTAPAPRWPDVPAACAAGWADPAPGAPHLPASLDCRLTGGRPIAGLGSAGGPVGHGERAIR